MYNAKSFGTVRMVAGEKIEKIAYYWIMNYRASVFPGGGTDF